jgi:CubicO group peptidase (beta-lactamase class C family)
MTKSVRLLRSSPTGFVLAIFVGCWALAASAQPAALVAPIQASEVVASDPRIEIIDGVLSGAAEEGLCGTILIRSHDRVLLHKAYGWADVESGREMTIDTGFDIGSLVKPITGSAVLKLEEMGKLATSDTLARFFPDAPADKREITVMQVLTHTAGMQDLFGGDYEVVSRDWILEKIMNAPLIAAPGTREEYSNSGYSLLAIIIEEVSGRPYEEFVRDEVLAPAGVHRLGYVLPGWANDELAVGYRRDGARWGTPIDHPWADDGPAWNLRGNGGMLSTAEEMGRWYEALFDGKVLGPEVLEKYYSYGAGESPTVGGLALAHAGGNGIFNTLQISWIDADTHMTFFSSCAAREAESIWSDFRDELISLGKEGMERR